MHTQILVPSREIEGETLYFTFLRGKHAWTTKVGLSFFTAPLTALGLGSINAAVAPQKTIIFLGICLHLCSCSSRILLPRSAFAPLSKSDDWLWSYRGSGTPLGEKGDLQEKSLVGSPQVCLTKNSPFFSYPLLYAPSNKSRGSRRSGCHARLAEWKAFAFGMTSLTHDYSVPVTHGHGGRTRCPFRM